MGFSYLSWDFEWILHGHPFKGFEKPGGSFLLPSDFSRWATWSLGRFGAMVSEEWFTRPGFYIQKTMDRLERSTICYIC